MMKKLTFLITVFFSASAFAKTPLDSKNPTATVTLDYFLEACTVVGETQFGMIPNFDCESYIYGVLDTYAATQTKLKKPQLCIPQILHHGKCMKLFWRPPSNLVNIKLQRL